MTEEPPSVTTPGAGLLEPASGSGGTDGASRAGSPNAPGGAPNGGRPNGGSGPTPSEGLWAPPLGLLRTARPRQWIKNLLVLAAPAAAGEPAAPGVPGRPAACFALFTCAAAAIYLVNDAKEVIADRTHPTKRFRPVAAGLVPVPLAYGTGLLLAAPALALALAGPTLPWRPLSITPFLMVLLRLFADRAESGAPEDVVLRDRPLQISAVAWLGLFGFSGVGL